MAKEDYKILIEDIDKDLLEITSKKISDHSQEINLLVNKIVATYCAPLDNLMTEISNVLNDSIRPSDEELDAWSCKLASCLYFVGEGVETIGVKQDIAKAYKLEKYNNAYEQAKQGTIADKTSFAELQSQQESLVHIIHTRAYKKALLKLDAGSEMLSSIKKVISRRMSSFNLSVVDKGGFK